MFSLSLKPSLRAVAASLFIGISAAALQATDGTFNQTTAGTYSWDTAGNWTPGNIADGSGFTATFTSGSTGTFIVTVDSDRTIGNLTFANHAWQLNGSSILTLAGGSTPLITVTSQAAIINAKIAGTQGFQTKGVLTLGGANTYTGTTTIGATGTGNSSSVTLTNNSALGATGTGNNTVVSDGSTLILGNGVTITDETVGISTSSSTSGALQASGTAEWAGNVLINNGNARIGTSNASSQLTVSGVIGNGTNNNLIISGLGTTVLSGVSTYTGTSLIYRGTLKLDGGNNRMPTGTAFTMGSTADASTFNLNGRSQQLASLIDGTLTSNRTVTNSDAVTASVLTLSGAADASFAGTGNTIITGNLSIVKGGIFNQTLAKTNSYTGNTTINAGTLTLADDATMTFYIGANGVNNRILGTGSLALNGDFIFDLTNAVATNGNSWQVADFSTLLESIGGTFSVKDFTKSGSIWSSGNYHFSELTGLLSYGAAIPEPSAIAALAGGLTLGACALRRRRSVC